MFPNDLRCKVQKGALRITKSKAKGPHPITKPYLFEIGCAPPYIGLRHWGGMGNILCAHPAPLTN